MGAQAVGEIVFKYEVAKHDFSKAGEASSGIKKILRQLGIPSQLIKLIAVATYEAEMNIIIHSQGGTLSLIITPERIKVMAKDTGPGIANIELAMKAGFSTASPEIREMGFGAGMGLPNMKRCADEFQIVSSLGQSTEITMVMNIQ